MEKSHASPNMYIKALKTLWRGEGNEQVTSNLAHTPRKHEATSGKFVATANRFSFDKYMYRVSDKLTPKATE